MPWVKSFEAQLGRTFSTPTLGETMFQVTSHSTYHRGQVNARLREIGGEPPLVDYIAWIWFGRPEPDWSLPRRGRRVTTPRPLGRELRSQFGDIDIYLFDQILRGRFDARATVLDAGCGDGRNLSTSCSMASPVSASTRIPPRFNSYSKRRRGSPRTCRRATLPWPSIDRLPHGRRQHGGRDRERGVALRPR